MNAKIQTSGQACADTILHSAAANGNLDIARFYVESGQYLNAQNGFRNTPLHCAIAACHHDVINVIMTSPHAVEQMDLSVQNIDGDTALHLAAKAGMVDLVPKVSFLFYMIWTQ